MNLRFKRGDIVTVRGDLVLEKTYFMEDGYTSDIFVEGMDELCGCVVHIAGLNYSEDKYLIHEDEYDCNWTDEMFVEYFVVNEELDIPDVDIADMLGGML